MKPVFFALTLLWLTHSAALAAGKELEGERAAATTACPSPEEARAKMSVPDGYEVRCFAHEPMVQNPVAMTWDHRGRLWVVEAYEYPEGTPLPVEKRPFGGEAKDGEYHKVPERCDGVTRALLGKLEPIPRDRVLILEDTDNDGVADKRTVFLEGLNLASGILCGDGGIYIGQQPHLLHFKDTDGDDHADEWRIVLTGFGREDTHELVNSFCWGPDGWLYMTHGVFTNSKVRKPGEPESKGFKFDAGMGRCKPLTGEFEVFADGTSNPWGSDYDARGNFFVSACVIDHFFHMAPGGIYVRQGGAPENPYSYEQLSSIVKHKHFRAAYAGVQIYQGGRYPKDTWGHAFIGNIHDNAVHEEVLTPVGSTFKCEPRRDFLRANDGWFRPVSTQTGPDGFLWIMDWCDKYPCYQNAKANPEGVDRERGRIWRIVSTDTLKRGASWSAVASDSATPLSPKGKTTKPSIDAKTTSPSSTQPPQSGVADAPGVSATALQDASRESKDMDLKRLPESELVKLLENPNSWMRRTARRMLVENWRGEWGMTTKPPPNAWLRPLIVEPHPFQVSLDAAWTLLTCDDLPEDVLKTLAISKEPALRTWAARIAGERPHGCTAVIPFDPRTGKGGGRATFDSSTLLPGLAADKDPSVALAAAIALRQTQSASLTVTKLRTGADASTLKPADALDAWVKLMKAEPAPGDPLLAFSCWQAFEPLLTKEPGPVLDRLVVVPPDSQLAQAVTYKSMRRLCDTRDARNMDLAIGFCEKIQSHDVLLAHALDGLVKGQESGVLKPTMDVSKPLAAWRDSKNAEVREHALDLAVMWGDTAAIDRLLSIVANPKAPEEVMRALKSLRNVRTDKVRSGLARFLASPPASIASGIVIEAIRTAENMGGDPFPPALLTLAASKDFGIQQAALSALAGRAEWAHAMLDAISANKLTAVGFPISVRRSLATSKDKAIRDHAFKVLGAWKDASDDVKALIAAKRKACLEGVPDLAMGKMLFTTTCATCHTLYGPGQKVGPELLGSGRSNLDAILANVIDPNQIIGNGYEAINVTTKDNRVVSGRMVEDTPSHVKLLAIGGAEQIVPRDQIAKLENTHQSTMPMGFGALPDDVFRNLIWYVLAPPEEGPLTKEKKAALSASIDAAPAKKPSGPSTRAIDWESISLWNPEWKVNAPDFERTPVKLADFHGRGNVLLMHPFTKDKPCSLDRTVKLAPGKPHKLSVTVAAHDQGDWELRVKVNGQEVKKSTVGHDGERWKTVTVDLSEYAGKEVDLRVEGAANGWSNEFGYWGEVKVE